MGKRFEINGVYYLHADIVALFFLWDDDALPAMWLIADDGKLVLEDTDMYEVVESFEAGVARAEYLLNEWRQAWLDEQTQNIPLYIEDAVRKREYALWDERQAFAEQEKERVAQGAAKSPGLWTFTLDIGG